ncbi:unnamed protein product [Mytilus edulis]|uniref:Uncharacterized protein n=1 Tax=Mytilus edulis TaxID=6550 RepID=A0A8S3TQN1_MYTED|nr:unnamed protein product [Mytilus edulis]
MNLEDTELSIQFYHYVDDIVGSEEVVKTRRRIFIALDNVLESANFTCISSGSKAEGLDLNGSDYDQMLWIMLRYFKTGVYSSSVEAWALLASLFYKCDRYMECIEILNYSLSKCTGDNILISLNNDIVEQSIFQDRKQTLGLFLACKHFILCEVIMIEPYNLLPRELAPLIKERIYRVIMFPPVVYMNVLQYLCLHHLGDNSGKVVALRDIELTVRERYHIRENEYYLTLANKCLSIAKNNVMENLQQTFISSGSKAEGLDIEGSDYDLMIVEKDIGVYESVHAVSSSLHGLTLLMATIHTKPGFTKLKVCKASEAYLQILYKWCETFQQELYISSDLYRKYRLPKRDTMIIHGPCVSSKNNLYDVAYSFHCMEWVKPAKQWINRSRWSKYCVLKEQNPRS